MESREPDTGRIIDTIHVVVGVLSGLLQSGEIEASVVEDAMARYDIDPDTVDPYLL